MIVCTVCKDFALERTNIGDAHVQSIVTCTCIYLDICCHKTLNKYIHFAPKNLDMLSEESPTVK